jgi:MoxR-like ATPase
MEETGIFMAENRLKYTGTTQPQLGETDPQTLQPLYPYFPSEELVQAVNLAILLKRPLLLEGEPGCGKTQLARAVAYELNLPYREWTIKSTSQAKEGLYSYDTVGRLRDAQLAATGQFNSEKIQLICDPKTYRNWGVLGEAFKRSQEEGQSTVILIDEIDKADLDFPNDLLLELDRKRVEVKETGERFTADVNTPPIIFITSNAEKRFPDAFLRRCLFHYVRFPDRERLFKIVKARFPTWSSRTKKRLLDTAIARFLELRAAMESDKGEFGKKVSTSELLDWITVLNNHSQDEALKALEGTLPFAEVLLKTWEDHQRYLELE